MREKFSGCHTENEEGTGKNGSREKGRNQPFKQKENVSLVTPEKTCNAETPRGTAGSPVSDRLN
jgi:hypothetical protein